MSSQQYCNISSSNIWSNHDISPEISCGSKWWLSVAFESKISLVNVFDRASQPYHLSLSRPLHAGTHNLPNFVLTGVTQTAREMDGTWLTITHHSILCCETLSYPNCFVESLVHSPKLTTGGNVYKTNPEVWTHVLMRVPTWANLGHRRLQGFMMLDHISFRIPSSHLAISNPSRFVHAHFPARQFSILFHNDSCLLMSFWKGPFHHQPLWWVNLFPPLPSTRSLYHSKRHDGASGWKTLHESAPRFVKAVTDTPKEQTQIVHKELGFQRPLEPPRSIADVFANDFSKQVFQGWFASWKVSENCYGDATHHDGFPSSWDNPHIKGTPPRSWKNTNCSQWIFQN